MNGHMARIDGAPITAAPVEAAPVEAGQIEAADHAARHWQFPVPGPLRVGTEQHKQAACRMFHETFNPYKPSVIDWPRLDPAAPRLARLAPRVLGVRFRGS